VKGILAGNISKMFLACFYRIPGCINIKLMLVEFDDHFMIICDILNYLKSA